MTSRDDGAELTPRERFEWNLARGLAECEE